ncbi:oligosaccharide flippase family protein [Kiritimatiellota bacterium B12222]|nr:oligosaccharide flippase family protein [Kiritimatiellota bacterium B12222]
MSKEISFKKQMPRNAVATLASFLSRTIYVIFLTPYLLDRLGPAAYGLVPLAGILTQYVSIIANSLSAAITRFISVELHKTDGGDPRVVFNTSIFMYAVLTVIQGFGFWLVIHNAQHILTIPEDILHDALVLITCSCIAFCMGFLGSVFKVSAYAMNRIDIISGLQTGINVLRIVLTIILFPLIGSNLKTVGYIELSVGIVGLIVYIVSWRILTPDLKISYKKIDVKRVKPILEMSGWVLVTQLGVLLTTNTDIWVANKYISADAGGVYAATRQISFIIRQISNMAFTLTGPIIITMYAQAQFDNLRIFSCRCVRYASLLLAVGTSVLCIYSWDILYFWLGAEYKKYGLMFSIMVAPLYLSLCVFPMFQIQTAAAKVRVMGIATLIFGVVSLGLSIVAVSLGHNKLLMLAMTGAIMLVIKNTIFVPLYTNKVLPGTGKIFQYIMAGTVVFILTAFIGWVIKLSCDTQSMFSVGFHMLVTIIVGIAVIWLVLEKEERDFLYKIGKIH